MSQRGSESGASQNGSQQSRRSMRSKRLRQKNGSELNNPLLDTAGQPRQQGGGGGTKPVFRVNPSASNRVQSLGRLSAGSRTSAHLPLGSGGGGGGSSAYGGGSDRPSPPKPTTAWEDAVSLVFLSLPIFVTMVSWVGMKVTDTAIVGHLGTPYLTATAMADLWTSSTGVFISGNILGIFCGQAIGAGEPQMAGVWLQVSLATLVPIGALVMLSWFATGTLLEAYPFNVKAQTANRAEYYAAVLAIAIPARIGLSQLTQFYQAQHVTRPSMLAALLAMAINALLGVALVLGQPTNLFHGIDDDNDNDGGKSEGLGWKAAPFVTVVACMLQLCFLLVGAPATACWPGWALRHVTSKRLQEFVAMYFPAALSAASDWWRVTAIGVVASSQGPVDLAVFNSSYRILWCCLIFTGALASATGIQLSVALGSGNAWHAKRLAATGVSLMAPVLFSLAAVVVVIPRQIAQVFSNDPDVLALYEDVKWPLAAVVVLMNLSVVLERIPLAMGRSKIILAMGLMGSWVGQVPAVLACTMFWRNDLIGLYTGVAVGYFVLCVALAVVIFTSDWEKFAAEAVERQRQHRMEENTTDTLNSDDTSSMASSMASSSTRSHSQRGGGGGGRQGWQQRGPPSSSSNNNNNLSKQGVVGRLGNGIGGSGLQSASPSDGCHLNQQQQALLLGDDDDIDWKGDEVDCRLERGQGGDGVGDGVGGLERIEDASSERTTSCAEIASERGSRMSSTGGGGGVGVDIKSQENGDIANDKNGGNGDEEEGFGTSEEGDERNGDPVGASVVNF